MAKKRKKPIGQPASPRAAAPAEPSPTSAGSATPAGRSLVAEVFRQPMLVLGWVGLAITVCSIGLAFRFRHDMEMGAIREPTGTILWAGITVTAFASYWRQARREQKSRTDQRPS